MRTALLGRSRLTVSAVGFGGIPIQRVSEQDAVLVVQRALYLGVTFIDTRQSADAADRFLAGR